MIRLYFYLLMLLSHNATDSNTIVIIGEAYNDKDGARIISEKNGRVYFLYGLKDWYRKVEGKRVKVWGVLKIEKINHKPPVKGTPGQPPPPFPQEITGNEMLIILNAHWKLMK